MRKNLIFILSALGILCGIGAAYLFGRERKPQPPVFQPVSSPYKSAIYANGIIESLQGGGSNINVYPEVPGTVVKVLVHEGQQVRAGEPLLMLDDSVPRATAEQLRLQAAAAQELLQELRAQPRKETLEIARAQLLQAQANERSAQDQYDKRHASHQLEPKSISQDVLDTALNSLSQAKAATEVARRQLALTEAGAWAYDIRAQESQARALEQAYQSAQALLGKYTLKAQQDGVVLSLNATPGSFVATNGAFDAYSQGQLPVLVMSSPQQELAVRCYVDEILVSRLPDPAHIQAEMTLRGTDRKVPLSFVRVQPYVTPKLELSNQRQERVDLRVLPVVFKFSSKNVPAVYPGQLVDVYIGQK